MEPRLKWNKIILADKIILAAKIILFRSDVVPCNPKIL